MHTADAGQESLFERPVTILIVDDEELVLDLEGDILQAAGYHVLRARSGKMALELSQAYPEPIELLLTDVIMPDMNGLELARRIRALRPRLRVLYASGSLDLRLVPPASPLLQKPFRPDRLLEKVRQMVSG